MNDHDDATEEGANAAAAHRSMSRGAARNDGGVRTTARSVRRARTVARNLRRIEDGSHGGGRLASTARVRAASNPFQILSPQGNRDGVRFPKGAIVNSLVSSDC